MKSPDQPNKDAPGVVAPPPVIYLGMLGISYLIHRIWPLQITPAAIVETVGAALIFVGLCGIAWSSHTMRRAHTNMNPYKPALNLITAGPFAYSRNPIYAAMAAIYLGMGFAINSLWPFILFPPLIEIMKWGVISREEQYLEKKFGASYKDYCSKVRRWF
jgi:protein-S-isoprenylcysteine O-methyltransferase Ste14